jgi:alanyl-tRNA synthetase
MTRRRYYEDAYRTSFDAEVLETADINGQPGLVLEETYFYPSSGGQPHDMGWIDESKVVDVVSRHEDAAIVHILDKPVAAGRAKAEIDWKRRFDHMQQHSGQHILSQSYLRVLGAKTVSFHMGDDTSTIDVEIQQLNQDGADAVELLANETIWENRTIDSRMVTRDEAMKYPMRKQPPTDSEELRLVVITDFDVSACGGTHVSRTGEIGMIKIIGWERRRGSIRAEFVCGSRALRDFGKKNNVIRNLSALYTTGYWELEKSIRRQIDEVSEQRRETKRLQKRLLNFEVAAILREVDDAGAEGSLTKVFTEKSPKELRIIANQLIETRALVVLLASVANRTSLVFAKSDEMTGSMNTLIEHAFTLLGSGSGGGSDSYAQGSSEVVDIDEVKSVLNSIT